MRRILSNYEWQTKNENITIKNMDTNHIKKVRNFIQNINEIELGGISKTTWLLAFNSELAYRTELGNKIISFIDKKGILRNCIHKCLKPIKYNAKATINT